MQRSVFKQLCSEVDTGNGTLVINLANNEKGLVTACIKKTDHFVVKTSGGTIRCWDYRDCKELQPRKPAPFI